MTRDDILDRVRVNLNDAGVIFWSSDDAADSIQDGYDEVAAFTFCIEKTYTLANVDGLLYYNLYEIIPDFIALKGLFNPAINKWMEPASILELKDQRQDWEKTTGQPYRYVPISFEYHILWPIYTGTQNYTLLYAASAETLSGDSVPNVPNNHVSLLEDYVTADLLEQAEEVTKAGLFWKDYSSKLLKLRTFIQQRQNMARIVHLSREIP